MPTKANIAPSAATSKRRRRDTRLSLLKVLGSIGVVVVHTSTYASGPDAGFWAQLSAHVGDAMGRNMSSIFAMVAGAILLARPSEAAPAAFVWQRLTRLLPAVVVWSAFYLVWRQINGEQLTHLVILQDVIRGMPYVHLWFLYAMLGLYALMPGMRLLVRNAEQAPAQYLTAAVLAGLTCALSISLITWAQVVIPFVLYTFFLLAYLLAGYLFYRDMLRLPWHWLLPMAVFCVLATTLCTMSLQPEGSITEKLIFQSIRVPLAMLWVVTIYLIALRVSLRPQLGRSIDGLATYTLGIYVLHPFFIDLLNRSPWSLADRQLPWWLAALLVFATSAGCSWLLARVRPLRRLVV